MRKRFLSGIGVLIVLFGLAAMAQAQFSIPADAYRMHELTQALENAKTDGWPMTFLLSNENTTCPFATTASENIIQALGEESLLVYIDVSAGELETAPDIVQKAFTSREAGRMLPIAVVTDPGLSEIVDIVPYKKANDAHLALLEKACAKIERFEANTATSKWLTFGLPVGVLLLLALLFGKRQ